MRKRGRKKVVIAVVIIILIILISFLIYKLIKPIIFLSPPTTVTIESTNDVGQYSSIALDSNGIAHISEYDWTNGRLRYCNNTAGTWSCVAIDTVTNQVGQYSSIAIDSNNVVHISYYDADLLRTALRYCNNTAGTWSCVAVDSANDVGRYSSIAIDKNNKVHISEYDATNMDLRYCNNIAGTWSCVTVDTDFYSVGQYSSIAIDSNNVVHISEYRNTPTFKNLRYCNNSGGSWSCAIIDTTGADGLATSIAIDSNNKVHISEYAAANGYLRYCNNIAGTWSCVSVETGGTYSSIAIDSNNKVHISHWDDTNDDLRYCNNIGGSWSCTKLEDTGTSFGRDNGDRWLAIKKGRIVDTTSFDTTAHMSWYNFTDADLMYTTTSIASPRLEVTLIEPLPPYPTLVTQNIPFPVKAKVCCYDMDCGEVDTSLAYDIDIIEDGTVRSDWSSGSYFKDSQQDYLNLENMANDYRPYIEFDVSTINNPDNIASVFLKLYVTDEITQLPATSPSKIHPLLIRPSLSSAQEIFQGMTTDYVSDNNLFRGAPPYWETIDLGSQVVSDLKNSINSGKDWFAIGISTLYADRAAISSEESAYDPQLIIITYKPSKLVSTTLNALPLYIASSSPTDITPSPANPTRISLIKDQCIGDDEPPITWQVIPTGTVGTSYNLLAYAEKVLDPEINDRTDKFEVEITTPTSQIKNLNIKDTEGVTDLLVTPSSGTNANVVISATVVDNVCQSFAVNAYLCDTTLSTCSDTIYTYNIPLAYQSKVGSECLFSYTGNSNTPQFWKAPGSWKLYVKSTSPTILENTAIFNYESLRAISYATLGEIDFGKLNELAWNEGKPSSGIELINHGNVALTINWQVSPFTCTLPCTTSWTPSGDLELDDDALREATETGLAPILLSSTQAQFPPALLPVCTSDSCALEKIPTYYHLNPPDLQVGDYENQITITLT